MDKQIVNINLYMQELSRRLQTHFPQRVVYLGLQGSYGRGEAAADSDIDIFVVLDALTVADLNTYKKIITSMDYAAKSCGFICGQQELANWNSGEICQLVNETKDYLGELKPLLPTYTDNDIINYLKRQVGDLYHQLCHQHIHSETGYSFADLLQAYKSTFYILQNKYYLLKGTFVLTKKELMVLLSGIDREVLAMALALKDGTTNDAALAYSLLFSWCQQQLHSL